jgi:hypothetical protein
MVISDEANDDESESNSDIDPERDAISAKIVPNNHLADSEVRDKDESPQEVIAILFSRL